jgi:hypothetical protein
MRRYVSGFLDVQAALEFALQAASASSDFARDSAAKAAQERDAAICTLCNNCGMPSVARNGLSQSQALNEPDASHKASDSNDVNGHLRCAFSPLRCAKWQFAVMCELAEPGVMELTPVMGADLEVVDFEWVGATPMASHLMDCAGANLVGQRLLTIMDGHPDIRNVFDVYRSALKQVKELTVEYRSTHGTRECVVSHEVKPSHGAISVVLKSSMAIDRAEKFKVALGAFAAKYAGQVSLERLLSDSESGGAGTCPVTEVNECASPACHNASSALTEGTKTCTCTEKARTQSGHGSHGARRNSSLGTDASNRVAANS